MSDPTKHFRLAIAAAGLQAPDTIEADGKIHRFSANGQRSDESGWYVLHSDVVPAGSFGCWREGLKQTWCSKSENAMTQAELAAYRLRIQTIKSQRKAEQAQRQRDASETAAARWSQAETCPPPAVPG